MVGKEGERRGEGAGQDNDKEKYVQVYAVTTQTLLRPHCFIHRKRTALLKQIILLY